MNLKTKNGPKNDSKNGDGVTDRKRWTRGLFSPVSIYLFGVVATIMGGAGTLSIYYRISRTYVKKPVLECKLRKYGVKEETIIRSELTKEQARHLPPENCEKKLCKWERKGKRSTINYFDCKPMTGEDLTKSKMEWKPKRTKGDKYGFGMMLSMTIAGIISLVTASFLNIRGKKQPANTDNQNVS